MGSVRHRTRWKSRSNRMDVSPGQARRLNRPSRCRHGKETEVEIVEHSSWCVTTT